MVETGILLSLYTLSSLLQQGRVMGQGMIRVGGSNINDLQIEIKRN